MEKEKLALIPYGIADFVAIRTEGYAYVDKTKFIEALEESGLKYPLIIRPRRFGKSLFTDMLSAYYNIALADKFNEYFTGTYIGKHKTKQANSFFILKLDFSGIDSTNIVENFIESDFAVALATAANFSPDFKVHLELYVTGIEKGYADLVLSPLDDVNCSYIFELKYLPKSKDNDEAVKEKLDEANTQLDRYSQRENIAKLPALKHIACVFVGTELTPLDLR